MRTPLYTLLTSVFLLACANNPAPGSARRPRGAGPSPPSPLATGGCIVAVEGQVHGTVARNEEADGPPVYVTVIFSGGPTERQRVRNGQYALPLLVRRCADGDHWVAAELRAVGVSKTIYPTGPDVREDLDVGQVPTSVPGDLPDCVVVAGTVSGQVLIHGAPAPDGTAVTSVGPQGAPSLSQATTTRNDGHYALPSIGLRCGSKPPRILIGSVAALGTAIPIVANEVDIQQDIAIP